MPSFQISFRHARKCWQNSDEKMMQHCTKKSASLFSVCLFAQQGVLTALSAKNGIMESVQHDTHLWILFLSSINHIRMSTFLLSNLLLKGYYRNQAPYNACQQGMGY